MPLLKPRLYTSDDYWSDIRVGIYSDLCINISKLL